jgi:hypothetical protein
LHSHARACACGALLTALDDGAEYVETVSVGPAIRTAFGACVPGRQEGTAWAPSRLGGLTSNRTINIELALLRRMTKEPTGVIEKAIRRPAH